MIPLNRNLTPLKRSGIRAFTNLARQTPGCAMLTLGEPDLDTPQPIKDAAWEALQHNQTHYAPNQGTVDLCRAAADYETARGMACEPSQVLITAGATEALFTALLGILNPGDEVIIPTPAFSLYETITLIAGAVPVALHTEQDGFQITADSLAAVMSDKTKAIILNSPNNPTGVVYTREAMDAVKAAILGKPIYLLCDNVYCNLIYGPCPDLTLDADLAPQRFLIQSFSKTYAMTGWRAGYLVGPQEVMDRLLLLHAAVLAAVPTFVQAACVTALETDPLPTREIYRQRRDYICSRLDEIGLAYTVPQGAFYVFPDISRFGIGSEEFCRRMITEAKLAAVPGVCFGSEGYIRLSFCYSMEELETAMDRMGGFIDSLR